MEHITCANCKHWGGASRGMHIPLGFQSCKLPKMTCDVTEYDADARGMALLPEFADLKFTVMEADECGAELQTRGDFYCACAEAK